MSLEQMLKVMGSPEPEPTPEQEPTPEPTLDPKPARKGKAES